MSQFSIEELQPGDHIARAINLDEVVHLIPRGSKKQVVDVLSTVQQTDDCPDCQVLHHGIVSSINPVRVIHFNSDSAQYDKNTAKIIETSLDTFMGDKKHFFLINHESVMPLDKTLQLARQYLLKGYNDYNVLFNNCEHFCFECKTGKPQSKQVKVALQHGVDTLQKLRNVYRYSCCSIGK